MSVMLTLMRKTELAMPWQQHFVLLSVSDAEKIVISLCHLLDSTGQVRQWTIYIINASLGAAEWKMPLLTPVEIASNYSCTTK